MAITLLNQQSQSSSYKVGDLIYLPDNLLRKNPNSVREALAYIVKGQDGGRNYFVKTLDGQILTFHFLAIVSTNANKILS